MATPIKTHEKYIFLAIDGDSEFICSSFNENKDSSRWPKVGEKYLHVVTGEGSGGVYLGLRRIPWWIAWIL